MICNLKILVVGGDFRSVYLTKLLINSNFYVKTYGLDFENFITISKENLKKEISQANIIILPFPVSKDETTIYSPLSVEKIALQSIIDLITKDQVVFGGMIPQKVYKILKSRDVNIYDYLEREEFAVFNAVPTAEGAIEIAMRELSVTLWKSKCLITGYGRIAKLLQKILIGMGADTTIAVRKHSDCAWANVLGSKDILIQEIEKSANEYDVIFNTVPSQIINKNIIQKLKPEILIIDLASDPGGVDFDEAKRLSLKTIWALSLPGKTSPKTASKIMNDIILNILEEKKLCQI